MAELNPRSHDMRPRGFIVLETEEEIVELSTVLTPRAGNAATTTTANLEPTRQGTELDSHDFSRMSDTSQHVKPQVAERLGLTRQKDPVTL